MGMIQATCSSHTVRSKKMRFKKLKFQQQQKEKF